MKTTAKELVKRTFRGRHVPRPPFIPFVGTYLTEVTGLSLRETVSDAGLLSQALDNTIQLLNHDAAVLPPDVTVEAEALGVRVRWDQDSAPAVDTHLALDEEVSFDAEHFVDTGRNAIRLEAARRFVQVHGRTTPVFATVSSPLTVWQQAYDGDVEERILAADYPASALPGVNDISQAVIAMCKAYGEIEVDGIFIDDGATDLPLRCFEPFETIYKSIFNVIRFHNIPGILRLPLGTESVPDIFNSWKASAWIDNADCLSGDVSKLDPVRGIPISNDFWSSGPESDAVLEKVRGMRSTRGFKNIFIGTSRPLDRETDQQSIQENIKIINDDSFWKE